MEPPDQSFADEFNVPEKYAVLVYDVSCGLASLPNSSSLNACRSRSGRLLERVFRVADEVPEEALHGSLAHLPKVFSSRLHGLSKVAVVRFCT